MRKNDENLLVKGRSYRGELLFIFMVIIPIIFEANWGTIIIMAICWFIFWWLLAWNIKVYEKETVIKKYFFIETVYPTDSINSTATSIFEGFWIATSSSKDGANWVTNKDKINTVVKDLIQKRLANTRLSTVSDNKPQEGLSIKDSLRDLKEIYDQGLITEEEYNTKKQELLNKF